MLIKISDWRKIGKFLLLFIRSVMVVLFQTSLISVVEAPVSGSHDFDAAPFASPITAGWTGLFPRTPISIEPNLYWSDFVTQFIPDQVALHDLCPPSSGFRRPPPTFQVAAPPTYVSSSCTTPRGATSERSLPFAQARTSRVSARLVMREDATEVTQMVPLTKRPGTPATSIPSRSASKAQASKRGVFRKAGGAEWRPSSLGCCIVTACLAAGPMATRWRLLFPPRSRTGRRGPLIL